MKIKRWSNQLANPGCRNKVKAKVGKLNMANVYCQVDWNSPSLLFIVLITCKLMLLGLARTDTGVWIFDCPNQKSIAPGYRTGDWPISLEIK